MTFEVSTDAFLSIKLYGITDVSENNIACVFNNVSSLLEQLVLKKQMHSDSLKFNYVLLITAWSPRNLK